MVFNTFSFIFQNFPKLLFPLVLLNITYIFTLSHYDGLERLSVTSHFERFWFFLLDCTCYVHVLCPYNVTFHREIFENNFLVSNPLDCRSWLFNSFYFDQHVSLCSPTDYVQLAFTVFCYFTAIVKIYIYTHRIGSLLEFTLSHLFYLINNVTTLQFYFLNFILFVPWFPKVIVSALSSMICETSVLPVQNTQYRQPIDGRYCERINRKKTCRSKNKKAFSLRSEPKRLIGRPCQRDVPKSCRH